MNKLLTILIFRITRIFPRQTLLSKSWDNIKTNVPEVYKLRRERRIYHLKNGINTPIVASLLMLFTLSCISLLCLFSWDFTDTPLAFLNFIKLENDDAKQLISDSLMATATISALSFVVINFLFDKVKNATHETYQTLFRATRLYYVLSFVLIGILMLIVLNLLKHTPEGEILGNMAVLSSYLSISIVGVIIWLFFRVLRFLNPQSVASISKHYLLSAAKFHRLDERFFEECNKELIYLFESKGFIKGTPFLLQFEEDDSEMRTISFVNHRQGMLFDVHLPIINTILDGVKKKMDEQILFFPVKYRELLNEEHPILAVNKTVNIGMLQRLIWRFAIWLKPVGNKERKLSVEKEKMSDSLVQTAGRGDFDGVKKQFDNIEDLYSIYYETK